MINYTTITIGHPLCTMLHFKAARVASTSLWKSRLGSGHRIGAINRLYSHLLIFASVPHPTSFDQTLIAMPKSNESNHLEVK